MRSINNKKNLAGFTLLEMIVNISIITLVSTLVLANYHNYGVKGNLTMAAQLLAGNIRQAQSFSLGLKQNTTANSADSGGWGVEISKQTVQERNLKYKIFYDFDNDLENDDNANERYRTIDLPKGIILSEINYAGNPVHPETVFVTYEPPDPVVRICHNTDPIECVNNVEFILQNVEGATASVMVNALGLVDVKN